VHLRVIGIGSPHGDDAVGLAVAERLAGQGVPTGVEVLGRSRPGLDLLDDLRGVDGVVLVDAMRSGAPPGTVRAVDPAALAAIQGSSSHGFGVAEALALASALGVRLPELRVVGIEVGPRGGAALSSVAQAALPHACQRVREALRSLARSG
jgi:hydrogenase maturation protease